jgi:hypothetical protein
MEKRFAGITAKYGPEEKSLVCFMSLVFKNTWGNLPPQMG